MTEEIVKLNIGCGENYLEGFINIDFEENVKCDVTCDIRKSTLPLKNETISEIWLIHVIEHIEEKHWDHVFHEINRVLKQNGRLVLAYPEFDVCAKYYMENHRGIKDFWKATLYGRQLYPGDYHVTPIRTIDFEQFLLHAGFNGFKHCSQPIHDYYTIAECRKYAKLTKEDVLRKEIFA